MAEVFGVEGCCLGVEGGEGPGGVVVGEGGEGRQALGLTEGIEPTAGVASCVDLPTLAGATTFTMNEQIALRPRGSSTLVCTGC